MGAIIDWCRVTFDFEHSIDEIRDALSGITGLMIDARECKGLHSFTHGVQLRAFVQFQMVDLCRISWGGEHQNGRAELDIPGAACGLFDWFKFKTWAETLPKAKLTRVDTAVDLLEGEHDIDEVVTWHQGGMFNVGGRNPKTSTVGDWLEKIEGRTLNIGKRENGKMLRVYEKGKQLGNLESEWVRFEVQFGSKDRVIPFDILTEPTLYFIGAYPALEQIITDQAGQRIATDRNTAKITFGKALEAMRRAYGKWMHTLVANGVDVADLVEAVSVRALPGRLQVSAVAADSFPDTVKDGFDRWRKSNAIHC